tara:strand:- start:496 stop:648 length:153 start_codon:yes stop_codon:yes gene_type:complete
MEFKLEKKLTRGHKTFQPGQKISVDAEMYNWLKENGYGDKEKKTKIKKDK